MSHVGSLRGIADMDGPAAGSTRSRMTHCGSGVCIAASAAMLILARPHDHQANRPMAYRRAPALANFGYLAPHLKETRGELRPRDNDVVLQDKNKSECLCGRLLSARSMFSNSVWSDTTWGAVSSVCDASPTIRRRLYSFTTGLARTTGTTLGQN
jgi:hypothetical protein